MKHKVKVALAAVVLSASIPALAQGGASGSWAEPAEAENNHAKAVYATMKAAAARAGRVIDWANMATIDFLNNAQPWFTIPYHIGGNIGADRNCKGLTNAECSKGGGGFGGAGATTTWTQNEAKGTGYCDRLDHRFDVTGNLIVPALSLPPGMPMSKDEQPHPWGQHRDIAAVGHQYVSARNPGSVALWHLHKSNVVQPRENWLGVYRMSGTSFWYARPAYLRPNGTINYVFQGNMGAFLSNVQQMPESCPPAAGGDFHFYYDGFPVGSSTPSCTWYVPNLSLGMSGYAYPDHTVIPGSSSQAWRDANGVPDPIMSCPTHKDLIREHAETILDEYTEEMEEPPIPVADEDVRECDKTSTVHHAIMGKIGLVPCPDGQESDPDDTPDPADPDDPDPGDEYNHPPIGLEGKNPPTGSSILAPLLDWFDLSIDLPASENCPVYPIEVPEWNWSLVIETHCPIIEENRAIISTIMIALFTMGSLFIVLRA